MPDFTNYSNFNRDANFSTVKFGSQALLPEVDLNEAQNILNDKINQFITQEFVNGFFKSSALSYSSGNLTLANDKAIVNGNLLTISSLTIALAEGETAYLDVYETEVTYQSTLKKYGNQQEANTVTNNIKDSRLSEESARRYQLQYNIVKATGTQGHTYLPVAKIQNGIAVDLRVKTTNNISYEFDRVKGVSLDLNHYYQRNIKDICLFQPNETWISGSGTQTVDKSNVKIFDQSLKIAENDNTAGAVYSSRWVSLDLSKFNDGSASSTNDYISLACYISNAAKIDTTTYGIIIDFETSGGQYYEARIKTGLANGWNYIKLAKSSIIVGSGSPSWSNITRIYVGWYNLANAIGEYISFQSLQLIRKDLYNNYANPFQKEDVADFTISDGQWFIGIEDKKLICRDLSGGTVTGLKSTKAIYSDFVSCTTVIAETANNAANFGCWNVDENNRIDYYVYDGNFYVRSIVGGGVETYSSISFSVSPNDVLYTKLEKIGARVKASIYKNGDINTEKSIYVITSLVSNLGFLAFISSSIYSTLVDSSITSLNRSYHSEYANKAKDIVNISRALPITTLEKEFARTEGFYFDKEYYFARNIKSIVNFQRGEIWTAGAGSGHSVIQESDYTNVKVYDRSLKIIENDSSQGVIYTYISGLSLNLTKFNDGGTSGTEDYINIACYISDVTKVEYLYFYLFTDGSNNWKYIFNRAAGLVTGWNFLKLAKSAFSVDAGSPTWATITQILCGAGMAASASGAYVSWQSIQMVRKDPSSNVPNPFQKEINGIFKADMELVNGEWFVGFDKEVICRSLNIASGIQGYLKGKKTFNDSAAVYGKFKLTNDNHSGYIDFYIDDNNFVGAYIVSDVLTLLKYEAGSSASVTTSMPISTGDIIEFMLIKDGTNISLFAYKNLDLTQYHLQTTFSPVGETITRLSYPSSNYERPYILSFGFTNTKLALKALKADVAKDIVSINRAAPTTILDKEFARNEGFYLDLDYYYKRNVKPMFGFQSDETWNIGAGTPGDELWYVKYGRKAYKITENDNTASGLFAANSTGFNLATFQDGSTSSTSDYITVLVYISDVTKVSLLAFIFEAGSGNSFSCVVNNASLATGWNYIKMQKALFDTSGTPNWNNITQTYIQWNSTANASASYVVWQLMQLVRNLNSSPVVLQREINGVWTKEMNTGIDWTLVREPDSHKVTMLGLYNSGSAMSLYSKQSFIDCCIYSLQQNKDINSSLLNEYMGGPLWYVDSNNYISCFIGSGTLYLYVCVGGSVTSYTTSITSGASPITMPSLGDVVEYFLVKSGDMLYLKVFRNYDYDTPFTITVKDVPFYNTQGYPGLCSYTGEDSLVHAFSVTTTINASYSNVANIAREIASGANNIQPEVNSQSLSATKYLNKTDATVQMLNPNGATRNVYLPTFAGMGSNIRKEFVIKNTANHNTKYALQICLFDGTVADYVYPGRTVKYYWAGTLWRGIDFSSQDLIDNTTMSMSIGRWSAAYDNSVSIGASAGSIDSADSVSVGNNCVAGDAGVAIGYYAQAGDYVASIAKGCGSTAERHGEEIRNILDYSSGSGVNNGYVKYSDIPWIAKTTDGSATEALLLGKAAARLTIANYTSMTFVILVTAVDSSMNTKSWELKGCIKNNNGTVALVGTVTKTVLGADASTSGWDVAATADDTNDSLKLTVTGAASTNIRWAAKAHILQAYKYA